MAATACSLRHRERHHASRREHLGVGLCSPTRPSRRTGSAGCRPRRRSSSTPRSPGTGSCTSPCAVRRFSAGCAAALRCRSWRRTSPLRRADRGRRCTSGRRRTSGSDFGLRFGSSWARLPCQHARCSGTASLRHRKPNQTIRITAATAKPIRQGERLVAGDLARLAVEQEAVQLVAVAIAQHVHRQQDQVGVDVAEAGFAPAGRGACRRAGTAPRCLPRGAGTPAWQCASASSPLDRILLAQPAGQKVRLVAFQRRQLERLDPLGVGAVLKPAAARDQVAAVVACGAGRRGPTTRSPAPAGSWSRSCRSRWWCRFRCDTSTRRSRPTSGSRPASRTTRTADRRP